MPKRAPFARVTQLPLFWLMLRRRGNFGNGRERVSCEETAPRRGDGWWAEDSAARVRCAWHMETCAGKGKAREARRSCPRPFSDRACRHGSQPSNLSSVARPFLHPQPL